MFADRDGPLSPSVIDMSMGKWLAVADITHLYDYSGGSVMLLLVSLRYVLTDTENKSLRPLLSILY